MIEACSSLPAWHLNCQAWTAAALNNVTVKTRHFVYTGPTHPANFPAENCKRLLYVLLNARWKHGAVWLFCCHQAAIMCHDSPLNIDQGRDLDAKELEKKVWGWMGRENICGEKSGEAEGISGWREEEIGREGGERGRGLKKTWRKSFGTWRHFERLNKHTKINTHNLFLSQE